MTWFLNAIYLVILICGSPWMVWRTWKGKNRRGWTQKLFGNIKPTFPSATSNQNRIWFHAVSVGEVNLLDQIIQELRSRQPGIEIAISTTTETGFDLALLKHPDCFVFFCPFDFSWAIKRVVARLKPDALVLVELEMWPNLISVTSQKDVPVVLINARLSEKSARGYGRAHWFLNSVFRKLKLVLCQSEEYAERFVGLGCAAEKVIVTGNVKFDGIQIDRKNERTGELIELAGINPSDKLFVAGSTQLEEDLLAAKAFQKNRPNDPNLRLILVPRHPERVGALVGHLQKLGLATQLRSEISNRPPEARWDNDSVLIVDVIGELGGWWGRANIAFVGGSMGNRGGQNMIEPAGYGMPVSFGPNTWNFNETVEQLVSARACRVVHGLDDLSQFLEWSLTQAEQAAKMGEQAQKVVLQHVGASQRTVESLCQILAKCRKTTVISDQAKSNTKAA